MQRTKNGIRRFAIAFIAYSVVNLMGIGSFSDFRLLCKGFSEPIIYIVYAFGLCYGILGILCGSRMMRFEEWARKTAVILVLASLFVGLVTNTTIFRNIKSLYMERQEFSSALDTILGTYIILAAVFTVFEIFFVYFFTRSPIKEMFRRGAA